MSDFERPLPSYRLVETRWDDDLQAIAAREMGDANRWPELVWLNSLRHPYITNDPRRVTAGVLTAGALIKVPAPVGVFTDGAAQGQVFERDCALVGKRLEVDASGDLAVHAGVDNIRQQLKHRIDTPRGQARRHPDYGCLIWRMLGTVNGPLAGAMGAQYVAAALAADYRVANVVSAQAQVTGDAVLVKAVAETIEGGAIDILAGTGN